MGKILTVKWTLIAADEYQSVVDWLLLHWNEKIAMQFVANVENKIELLAKFPLMGTPSEVMPACYKTLIPPYHVIIYKLQTDSIEIIRLFDTRQNPEKLTAEDL